MISNEVTSNPKSDARRRHFMFNGTVGLIVAAMGIFATATTATAQSVTQVEFDGSKTRVNLSGRLGMLNQSIAASACRIGANIDVENASKELRSSLVGFSQIIKGLRESDTSIGIPTKERKARVLASIWKMEQTWVKQKFAAQKILDGVRVGQYVDVIAELTPSLDETSIELASEIIAQYTNPTELLTGDALTISVVGRQRKLSQQMSKQFCGIATEQEPFGVTSEFVTAANLFDKSLAALSNGMPGAGIRVPPNDYIKSELQAARQDWDGVNTSWLKDQSIEKLPGNSQQLREILLNFDNVVTLYMLATPGSDDVYQVPVKAYAEWELANWIKNPELIEAIKAQNIEHTTLLDSQVNDLDLQWRAEAKSSGARPLIDRLLDQPISKWLAKKQRESAGLVTEVFVMDNKGLNVAQSAETSDYWQGDEAKWKQTFGDRTDTVHISEVEFDDSTGAYQSQVSMAIRDPQTGDFIGAVTFGINVQDFL